MNNRLNTSTVLTLVILGVCFFVSLYTAHIVSKSGNSNGAWVFIAFALFFGVPLFSIFIKAMALRSKQHEPGNEVDASRKKGFFERADEIISGKEQPAKSSFVPHWFMMTMIVLTVVGIILAIFLPKIFSFLKYN